MTIKKGDVDEQGMPVSRELTPKATSVEESIANAEARREVLEEKFGMEPIDILPRTAASDKEYPALFDTYPAEVDKEEQQQLIEEGVIGLKHHNFSLAPMDRGYDPDGVTRLIGEDYDIND